MAVFEQCRQQCEQVLQSKLGIILQSHVLQAIAGAGAVLEGLQELEVEEDCRKGILEVYVFIGCAEGQQQLELGVCMADGGVRDGGHALCLNVLEGLLFGEGVEAMVVHGGGLQRVEKLRSDEEAVLGEAQGGVALIKLSELVELVDFLEVWVQLPSQED